MPQAILTLRLCAKHIISGSGYIRQQFHWWLAAVIAFIIHQIRNKK
jgi:hypothetical protein